MTQDRYQMREKLNQFNSGVTSELFALGIELAGFHIEAGSRTFTAYTQAMVADMGNIVKPHLKSWYMALKYAPETEPLHADMDSAATVESADIDSMLNEDIQSENSGTTKTTEEEEQDQSFRKWVHQKHQEFSQDEELIHNTELDKQIKETWQASSPKMYQDLKRERILDKTAFVLQELMWQENDRLKAAGMPPTDARETAEREWLMLEPEEEE